jgi:hypothetical protein
VVFSLSRTAGGVRGTAVEDQALPVGSGGEVDTVDLCVLLCTTLALGEVSGGGAGKGSQKGEDDGD